jgi:hypothetical protein
MWARHCLPEHHINEASKDTVKIGVGLIATMTALLLGLIISSANTSFKGMDAQVKEMAVNILTLDTTLARYGAETKPIRADMHNLLGARIESLWPQQSILASNTGDSTIEKGDLIITDIHNLKPQNDDQRWLKSHAEELGESFLANRWFLLSSTHIAIPKPMIVILICWLTIIFISFGLFAPRNTTVILTLFVCAISVASSIFLVVEMEDPFNGLIKITPDAFQYAYTHMNTASK